MKRNETTNASWMKSGDLRSKNSRWRNPTKWNENQIRRMRKNCRETQNWTKGLWKLHLKGQ